MSGPVAPSGTTALRSARPVVVSVAATGLATYGFHVIAARALGPEDYAPLAGMWFLLVLVGPGLFLPWEQEISRSVASRSSTGDRPVVLIGAAGAAVVVGVLALAGAALLPGPLGRLLADDLWLFAALACSVAAFAAQHVVRGALAGGGRFGRYAAQIGAEGGSRLALVVVLALVGVAEPALFGFAIAAAALVSLLATTGRGSVNATYGATSTPRQFAGALGWLVAASVGAQFVINAPPLALSLLDLTDDPETLGSLQFAFILARVPIFLFGGIQATLLPHLAEAAAVGAVDRVRAETRNALVAVAALGAIGVASAATIGPAVARWLAGSDYTLAGADLGLIVAAVFLHLGALVASQPLIALSGHRRAATPWVAAGAAFVVTQVGLSNGPSSAVAAFVVAELTALVAIMTHLDRLTRSR